MLRIPSSFSRRSFFNSAPVLSQKFLRKKKEKIEGLPANFLQELNKWPVLLQHEIDAGFAHIKEILAATNNDWTELVARGAAIPHVYFISKTFDALSGTQIILKKRLDLSGPLRSVFRSGTPVMVCKADTLKSVTEGIFQSSNKNEITLKVKIKKESLDDTTEYVILPSQELGVLQSLSKNLSLKNVKKTAGKNLLNLAFKGEVMPSVHSDRPISTLSDELNDSQKRAIAAALNNKRPFLCIQGPPGTGKTRVVAEIIKEMSKKKQKVLVCAPSYVAVNNVMDKTMAVMNNDNRTDDESIVDATRLTDAVVEHPKYQMLNQLSEQLAYSMKDDKLVNNKAFWELRYKIMKEVYKTRKIIFTTLNHHIVQSLSDYNWTPDVVIIDEAAQCTEPQTWAAVLKARRCILVGDHAQLPAVIVSQEGKKEALNRSLMERLCTEFESSNLSFLLSTQYRMNENIMKWSSDRFYESQLVADESVANIKLSDISLVPEDNMLNSPMLLVDTARLDDSREEKHINSLKNTKEGVFIRNYVEYLLEMGVYPSSIGVITPYYAQMQSIRNMVDNEIAVNTVDGFQGQEKEVIIFSLVRNNLEKVLGFLKESRRMNVAVTRAKRQFCLVGSGTMMQNNGTLRSLYRHIKNDGIIRNIADVKFPLAEKRRQHG